jgi:hypothetical protein
MRSPSARGTKSSDSVPSPGSLFFAAPIKAFDVYISAHGPCDYVILCETISDCDVELAVCEKIISPRNFKLEGRVTRKKSRSWIFMQAPYTRTDNAVMTSNLACRCALHDGVYSIFVLPALQQQIFCLHSE